MKNPLIIQGMSIGATTKSLVNWRVALEKGLFRAGGWGAEGASQAFLLG